MGGVGLIPYAALSDWLDDNLILDPEHRQEYRIVFDIVDRAYVAEIGRQAKEREKQNELSRRR